MESVTFFVKGSSFEPYRVVFSLDGQRMTAECSCQAGQNGQVCKHRVDILIGDFSAVVEKNILIQEKFLNRIKGTNLLDKLLLFKEAEKQLEIQKKKVEFSKKELAKIMRG